MRSAPLAEQSSLLPLAVGPHTVTLTAGKQERKRFSPVLLVAQGSWPSPQPREDSSGFPQSRLDFAAAAAVLFHEPRPGPHVAHAPQPLPVKQSAPILPADAFPVDLHL